MQYFLGIDGGGTGCRVRLRHSDGSLLGEGVGGPGNIRLGLDGVWANLQAAISRALNEARLDDGIFRDTSIGLGLAGIVDAASAAATIAAGPRFGHAVAVSDAHIACLGAFGGQEGAILITGTGSAGYAWIGGRGIEMFGWGFEIDDKGSAASVGRGAVRAVTDAFDRLIPETDLTIEVRAAIGTTRGAIVDWITTAQPRDYGTLAPIVMQHAAGGDPTGLILLRTAAGDIEVMMARLIELGAARVCLVGGMAKYLRPWLSPWAKTVLADPAADAVEGAVLLARREFLAG